MSSIWAKGRVLDDCVCVIYFDMTTRPWWREKVMDHLTQSKYILMFAPNCNRLVNTGTHGILLLLLLLLLLL